MTPLDPKKHVFQEDTMTDAERVKYEAWIEAEYQKAKRKSAGKDF